MSNKIRIRMTWREYAISLVWWIPIYFIAQWISHSFTSGGIAAILAVNMDRLYVGIKDLRAESAGSSSE